jgi:hypothetical protein
MPMLDYLAAGVLLGVILLAGLAVVYVRARNAETRARALELIKLFLSAIARHRSASDADSRNSVPPE